MKFIQYIIPFIFLPITYWLFQYCISKYTDVFSFKYKNYYYSATVCYLYVLCFILLAFGIRVYTLGKSLDLRILIFNIKNIYAFYVLKNSIIDIIIINIDLIIGILFVIILFSTIHRYCILHLFIIFFYYNAIYTLDRINKSRTTKFEIFCLYFWHYVGTCERNDIVTTFINVIIYESMKIFYGENFYSLKFPKYYPHRVIYRFSTNKYYRTIIKISPLLIFVYDCICNDFIIIHFYYYILFYIPIMLIQRFTTFYSKILFVFSNIIWCMYYGNNKDIYGNLEIFAISKKDKILLDYLIKHKFSDGENIFGAQTLDISVRLFSILSFSRGTNDTFINEIARLKFIGNELVEVLEDNEGNITYGEEWILLQGLKNNS